jgi:hypothetical protein
MSGSYKNDKVLSRTRLQILYNEYGLNRSFTRNDVVSMFPSSYKGLKCDQSAYRLILKPAIEDLNEMNIPILLEDKKSKPYKYTFQREPSVQIPFIKYDLIQDKLYFEDEQEFELNPIQLASLGADRINTLQKMIINEFNMYHPTKYKELVNKLLITKISFKKTLNYELQDLINKKIICLS